MRCLPLLVVAALAAALEVPPPADPAGLGERLAMLDYLRERGVKARSGLDDAAVRALYVEAWQSDPANRERLAEMLRADADGQAKALVREDIIKLGGQPDAGMDLAALKAMRQRLEGERLEAQAAREREAAERGEMVLQQVRFKDGGTLHGYYDAAKQRLEVCDAKTGKRQGLVTLNPDTIVAVIDVTIRITPLPMAEPDPPLPETPKAPAPRRK